MIAFPSNKNSIEDIKYFKSIMCGGNITKIVVYRVKCQNSNMERCKIYLSQENKYFLHIKDYFHW